MKDIHYLLLAEIIDGYSVLSLDKGVNFYFKHPIVKDVLKESLQRRDLENQADRIGLKSKEEAMFCSSTTVMPYSFLAVIADPDTFKIASKSSCRLSCSF
jgi:hypothetical protein